MSGPPVTLSLGMGVDSAALLTRWLLDPASRTVPDAKTGELVPFTPDRLVCVTAMTGDEYAATAHTMEQYLLPLMERAGVRYVQVARASQSDSDGIMILSDSTGTRLMHMRGPWRLSDELTAAGTVPQVSSGRRLCSYRAKGWVLDQWAAQEYAGAQRVHVIGFAAEETGRAKRDSSYTQACRTPDYPLIRWGWDRDRCAAYLADVYASPTPWPRSCCGYCPFQAGPDIARLRERWTADPDAAVQALTLEAVALALNPRMALFGDRTARQVAEGFGLGGLARLSDARVAAMPAALYEVRRVFRRAGDRRSDDGRGWLLGSDPYAKGQVWRSLRRLPLRASDRQGLVDALRRQADTGELEDSAGGVRLWFERARAPYPATERYLVVAPAGIEDKQRPGFEGLWTHAQQLCLPRQLDILESVR